MIDHKEFKKISRKVMSSERASRATDPSFYAGLNILPNPDPLLRSMGKADEVYDAIMSDAHVLGEVRSFKSGIQGFKLHLLFDYEDDIEQTPEEKAAFDLCKKWLGMRPSNELTMQDLVWNMATGILYGQRVHEMVWVVVNGHLLPKMKDRPNRRFIYDTDNQLRLLTKTQPIHGEETLPHEFAITRHMPSCENPYGRAVLSACFWPYTFKHGGMKFFYDFCERFGLPFPIGRYPAGTPVSEQKNLLDALISLLEDQAAVVPEGDTVELLTTSTQGELAQEQLVHLCNAEMTKALSSQTLATEMRNVGSNAAAKTHMQRQENVAVSDRYIIAETFNDIFAWITQFNFGDDVRPPKLKLKKPPGPEEVLELYKKAAEISDRVPLNDFHKATGIRIATDDEETLSSSTSMPQENSHQLSSCNSCGSVHSFSDPVKSDTTNELAAIADKAIADDFIQPLADMLLAYEEDGKTLKQFQQDLHKVVGDLDTQSLANISAQAMALAFAQGMESHDTDDQTASQQQLEV